MNKTAEFRLIDEDDEYYYFEVIIDNTLQEKIAYIGKVKGIPK